MSQDIGMGRTCDLQVRLISWGAWWASGGLVVFAWVDDQVAQDLAGRRVDDGDVEVLDEQDDVGSGVGSADTDVPELAGDAEGHAAGLVDLVVADPVVGVVAAVGARGGLGQGRVVGRGGGSVRQRAVRSLGVVGRDEQVQQDLQLDD